MNERPNIRRMQVPEQVEKNIRWSDIERELQVHRVPMLEKLTKMEETYGTNKQNCVAFAGHLKFLFPDESSLPSGRLLEFASKELARLRRAGNVSELGRVGLSIKMLAPDGPSSLSEEDWTQMNALYEDTLSGKKGTLRPAFIAEPLRIVFPQKPLSLPDSVYEQLVSAIEKEFKSISLVANFSAQTRILFSGRYVPPTKDQWASMRDVLKRDASFKHYTAMADLAVDMKILAANEIRITDRGIEAIMQQEDTVNESDKSVPESLNL